jgi:hypothetical protein
LPQKSDPQIEHSALLDVARTLSSNHMLETTGQAIDLEVFIGNFTVLLS